MDAISDPGVREVWLMKSAQVGATEIINNILGYHIHHDPAPMLLVQPTVEMAEAWSKDRLAPMLRDTPALRGRVADPKSRDSGNTILHKRFAGGHLTIAGANAPAGLASRPIRIVLFDEVDRYPASAGTEGDPVSLGRKRTTTYWNRKLIAASTPTIKGSSRIEAGYESGDQRVFEAPCPRCAAFQRLVWSQVRWDEGHPETAHYVCLHCAAQLDENDRRWMLGSEVLGVDADGIPITEPRGRWVATKPFRGIASFHISELYSPWVSWSEMAAAFLEAKRLPETLQTWINTALGESWEESGEAAKGDALLLRREPYTAASLPPGILMLTRGTDVQDDRLESTLWGWGRDGEFWRVEHNILRGDPGQDALWHEHTQLLAREYRTDDGRRLVCEATAVDSGGHHTQAVYRYCHAYKRNRVWAIKGVTGPKPAWPRKATRLAQRRTDLWPIGVDTIKDVVLDRLRKVTEPGPGYCHLDATTDDVAVEQLTAETKVYAVLKGRKVRVWKLRRPGLRNEQCDTLVYAYAAMIGRGGSDLLGRRTAESPAPQQTIEATPDDRPTVPGVVDASKFSRPQQPTPQAPRTPWVKRWSRT